MSTVGMPTSACLTREIRLAVRLAAGRFQLSADPPRNTWSGSRGDPLICPFLRMSGTVRGPIAAPAGCVCLVQELDGWLRSAAAAALDDTPFDTPLHGILASAWEQLRTTMAPGLQLVTLQLEASPYVRYARHAEEPQMLLLTQQFEFSATHRLHAPELENDENRILFGKCNRPAGHGHNYVLDVTVRCRPDDLSGQADASLFGQLEALVLERVIRRFDHTRLDTDCTEFAQLNSTVENIARVIWQLLVDQLPDHTALHKVRVYETPKTWADVGP